MSSSMHRHQQRADVEQRRTFQLSEPNKQSRPFVAIGKFFANDLPEPDEMLRDLRRGHRRVERHRRDALDSRRPARRIAPMLWSLVGHRLIANPSSLTLPGT